MKNIILAMALVVFYGTAVLAQKPDTSRPYSPAEKHEMKEVKELRKNLEQQQLNAPYEKLNNGEKSKEAKKTPGKKNKEKCRKHRRSKNN